MVKIQSFLLIQTIKQVLKVEIQTISDLRKSFIVETNGDGS